MLQVMHLPKSFRDLSPRSFPPLRGGPLPFRDNSRPPYKSPEGDICPTGAGHRFWRVWDLTLLQKFKEFGHKNEHCHDEDQGDDGDDSVGSTHV